MPNHQTPHSSPIYAALQAYQPKPVSLPEEPRWALGTQTLDKEFAG